MRWLAFTASLLVLAAAPRRPTPVPDPQQQYAVSAVVDGDTIDVNGLGRVRLLGVDAPEIGIGFDTPAPFAREARDFMASALVGRWVRLELDVEIHDTYGRLLAYVIRDDGVDVNAALVRAGLARISARYPLRRLAELQAAEAAAQAARHGMWGELPSIAGTTTYRVPSSRSSRRPKPQGAKPRRTKTRSARRKTSTRTRTSTQKSTRAAP
jgi:micrococcal nuclease